jgi:hypothetical protein
VTKRRPHWYFITYYECPVCGRGQELRERRYGQKPDRWWDRHEYVDDYDHCLE